MEQKVIIFVNSHHLNSIPSSSALATLSTELSIVHYWPSQLCRIWLHMRRSRPKVNVVAVTIQSILWMDAFLSPLLVVSLAVVFLHRDSSSSTYETKSPDICLLAVWNKFLVIWPPEISGGISFRVSADIMQTLNLTEHPDQPISGSAAGEVIVSNNQCRSLVAAATNHFSIIPPREMFRFLRLLLSPYLLSATFTDHRHPSIPNNDLSIIRGFAAAFKVRLCDNYCPLSLFVSNVYKCVYSDFWTFAPLLEFGGIPHWKLQR